MLNQINFGTPILRSLPTRKGRGRCVLRQGFTALELVGVLAIIAILAAMIIPNVIRRIDRAAWERETSDLNVMANGLVRTILNEKAITNQFGLSNAIASYLDLSTTQVHLTPRGIRRYFLTDPNVNINGAGLQYVQGDTGSKTRPTNVRVIMISTISRDLPSGVSSVNASQFDNIWTNADSVVPTPLSGWGGKGEDLCVKRVDLSPYFHRLYLLNLDTNTGHVANWQLEGNAVLSLETNLCPTNLYQTNIYVLHGTALNLYATHQTASIQMRWIINQDESFVYQNDRWGRSLLPDQQNFTPDPNSFSYWVARFLSMPAPPYAPSVPKFSATQRAVIDEFYNYLWGYWSWGNAGFPSENPTPQNPFFKTVSDAQERVDTFTANLIGQ